jgi:hypothetical protein
MAITPRTIFSSPASATVATVALLAFSAVGTLAYQVANRSVTQTGISSASSCESVREVIGPNMSSWSENAWIVLASCYEQKDDSAAAARVATHGVHFYPKSETLYNIAGYNQIVRGEFSRAVAVLGAGVRNVERPTNGVMRNNLAWASLWVSDSMRARTVDARSLYQQSLTFDQNSCETLHTGLWVEYSIASNPRSGIDQAQALRNFQNLRARYNSCQSRINDGQWKSMVEVVGASVLFENVDSMLAPRSVNGAVGEGTQSVRQVTQKLRENYKGVSIQMLCNEAMPLAQTRGDCVRSVSNAIHALKRAEVVQRHQHRRSSKNCAGVRRY